MRFGRKSGAGEGDATPGTLDGLAVEEIRESGWSPAAPPAPGSSDRAPSEGATGPFDVSEVDVEERDCIDLGSLLVTPTSELELQLQVDEESGEILAVLLVGQDGALELRAFAASRGASAWDELRPRIVAEMANVGGTAQEQRGSFGAELVCMVPVQTPEGEPAVQANRIVGCEGPAWLLRATLMGPAALDDELSGPWEERIRQVVVRRGRGAMPPGSALPLTLPPEARRPDGQGAS